MSLSYTMASSPLRRKTTGEKVRVLVTGAAGNIGAFFAEHASEKYSLRLMVHEKDEETEPLKAFGEVVTCDLLDLDKLKKVCEGIDTIVHLAGNPSPNATWTQLREANICGTYNVFIAAKSAGCRRVIYASSIHAVSGYRADMQVKTSDPVNPGDLYGVSKCFGEALARYMAEKEGVSAICLRIGAFQPQEKAREAGSLYMLDAWVSHRDLHQLIEECIDDEKLQYAIFNGLSDNRFKRLDISDARELVGYAPQDDLTEVNPRLHDLSLKQTVNSHSIVDGQKSGLREELKK